MKNMRSVIALVLAAMLLCCLAACGVNGSAPASAPRSASSVPDTQPPAQETEPAGSAAEPEAETPEPAGRNEYSLPLCETTEEISVWLSYNQVFTGVAGDLNENPSYQELEKRTNVHANFAGITADQKANQFNIMVASGDWYDLIGEVNMLYKGGVTAALSDGVILELSELTAQYAPNYTALVNSSEVYQREARNDDGDMGAMFVFMGLDGQDPDRLGPAIRQDWLDALGLDKPVTYDDYYNVLKAFKSEYNATMWVTNAAIPAYNFMTNGYDVSLYCGAAATMQPFYQIDGRVTYGPIEAENARAFLTMFNKWYSEGLIYQDFLASPAPFTADISPVMDGSVGIFTGTRPGLGSYDAMATAEGFNAQPIQDAQMTADSEHHLRSSYGVCEGAGCCVSTTCEKPELCVRWLDYLYSDDGVLLMNYGIEDLTFRYDESGKPCLTELISKNPDGMTVDQAIAYYISPSGTMMMITQWQQELTYMSEKQLASTELWTKLGDDWKMPANISMTSDESARFSELYTEIQTYVQTGICQFVIGERSLDEYDAFVQQIKDMGIDECIALKQAALDRYLER